MFFGGLFAGYKQQLKKKKRKRKKEKKDESLASWKAAECDHGQHPNVKASAPHHGKFHGAN